MKKTEPDLYEMLTLIGERPALYLGEPSISLLGGWIEGWRAALGDSAFKGTEPPFIEFHDWVALRHGFYESTSGWRRMLLQEHSGNEVKAFEHFFKLFHEFCSRSVTVIFSADVDQTRKPENWVDTDDWKVLPWPLKLEIIKYTEDKGVFLRFRDSVGEVYRDEYRIDLERAFAYAKSWVDRDEWVAKTAE